MVINIIITGEGKKKDFKEERPVLIKDIQLEPVKDEILHIDFNQISLTEKIEVQVPIEPKGQAKGVKEEGGVLNHILWELEVKCLPTMIPEKIAYDVTEMKIGDDIHVKDLKVPEGVEVLSDLEAMVFTLTPPMKEVAAEEGAEGEAAGAEPEVIKKEKKEKAEEGEEAPKEKAS